MIGTLLHFAKQGGMDLGQWRALALVPPPASPPQRASTSPLDPLDATAGWNLPDLIVFVYGVMLGRRYVTLLGAAGGVGKSASIAATAVCCALGRALLGEDVSGKSRMSSINLEDSRSKYSAGSKPL
jgi:hypothetical protein